MAKVKKLTNKEMETYLTLKQVKIQFKLYKFIGEMVALGVLLLILLTLGTIAKWLISLWL